VKDLVVIGGGGHAKVVIATARAAGYEVIGVLDDDDKKRIKCFGRSDHRKARSTTEGTV